MTDVAVVGSGPNGLAAAVLFARAGLSVEVFEAQSEPGGGTRTRQSILPDHWHDICSAVHPMAFASPFFKEFELGSRLDWVVPEVSYAHPLDHGRAALAYLDFERTVAELGQDGSRYARLISPLIKHSETVMKTALGSLLRVPAGITGPLNLGLGALWQGGPCWNAGFATAELPAMLSGVAAHSVGKLPNFVSAAAGLVLGHLAHTTGWPIPVGGSRRIAEALVADLQAHGGRVHTGQEITSLAELSPARAIFLDVSPQSLLAIAGDRLPQNYQNALRRFRYNNAACKVDFILSEPVPWQNPGLALAGSVHAVGSRADTVRAEAEVARGVHPERPYVLLSQPSQFDASRAPAGHHVLWSYCHVPAGSDRDMTEQITAQIERFAPGFRDTVLHSKVTTAAELASYNANYVGGDFGSGTVDLRQLLARPVFSAQPWKTPIPGVYLCSASTPPGLGVHGMSGMHAARLGLKEVFGLAMPTLKS
ncbi:phytoene desaturase family protein [Psychromicrobium lacuslunae]|uniref:Dehydrogenase n=1 Tax=Psychromicrobium lacuslunae TaxID=1618207 RepID=A0A0D4C0M5_9MICC|nr:NAD(P)/FAD-dependent oxidoreductase [Psychromicrobium lacuslunae]AJT42227.1 dehydrogenase [Psychromicrobium lacuslunae]